MSKGRLGSLLISTTAILAVIVSTASARAEGNDSAIMDVNVEVKPVVSIAVDGLLSLPVEPSPSGTFVSGDLSVKVSTNNQTGYSLQMEDAAIAEGDDANTTSLTHLVNSDLVVPSLDGDKTVTLSGGKVTATTNFDVDHWGYSLKSSTVNRNTNTSGGVTTNKKTDNWTGKTSATFSKIPSAGEPVTIAETGIPASQDESIVTFGAKITDQVISGTYANTMLFTAVTNYVSQLQIAGIRADDTMDAFYVTIKRPSGISLEQAQAINYVAGDFTVKVNNKTVTVLNVEVDADGNIVLLITAGDFSDGLKRIVVTAKPDTAKFGIDAGGVAALVYTHDVEVKSNQFKLELDDGTKITTMQQFAAANVCANTTTPSISAVMDDVPHTNLMDERDGKYYNIRKLADGNCWMTENLQLSLVNNSDGTIAALGVDGTSKTLLTADNTDIHYQPSKTGGVANKVGRYVWDESDANRTALGYTTLLSTKGFDKYMTQTGSSTGTWTENLDGNDAYNKNNVPHSYANPADQTTLKYPNQNGYETQYLGNYYNWYTATAGTGLREHTTSTVNVEGKTNIATDSICPAGWQLPTDVNGSDAKSWNVLINKYANGITVNSAEGSALIRSLPLSIVLSGYYYYNGGVFNRGSYGGYWSASVYSELGARRLGFDTTNVYPRDSLVNKGFGFSVRCVAR